MGRGRDHLEELRQSRRELLAALVDIEEQIERHELQRELADLTPEERRKLWRIIWGGKA